MSDAAVRAVRLGLRMAFWRAITPAVPRNLAIGDPTMAATGRASTGPRTDTARNRPSAPSPTTFALAALSPRSKVATATTVELVPTTIRRFDTADRSWAMSRNAAIGGTFDARRAGITADTIVTTTPTIIETATVAVVMIMVPMGIFTPNAAMSALMPSATPIPANRPTAEATAPVTAASARTAERTWRPVAPTARSRAISLVRCDTMIEKVLLMMNAPTNTAMRAKIVRNVPNWLMSFFSRSWCSLVSVAPVMTWFE